MFEDEAKVVVAAVLLFGALTTNTDEKINWLKLNIELARLTKKELQKDSCNSQKAIMPPKKKAGKGKKKKKDGIKSALYPTVIFFWSSIFGYAKRAIFFLVYT